jgi:hypothetical protein
MVLTIKEIQEEALKILNDAFHDTYKRPKGQNEAIHCAHTGRDESNTEENQKQLTVVA